MPSWHCHACHVMTTVVHGLHSAQLSVSTKRSPLDGQGMPMRRPVKHRVMISFELAGPPSTTSCSTSKAACSTANGMTQSLGFLLQPCWSFEMTSALHSHASRHAGHMASMGHCANGLSPVLWLGVPELRLPSCQHCVCVKLLPQAWLGT